MTALQVPDILSLLGNMKNFKFSTTEEISFILMSGSDKILEQSYTPGADGIITVDLKDVLRAQLNTQFSDSSVPYKQSSLVKNFTVTVGTGYSYSFSVIRAGVDHLNDSSANFLTNNFLTWQPNMKGVTYYSPEFLTYYAAAASVCKCKVYTSSSSSTLTLASIPAGEAWTIPVQYAIIAGKSNVLPQYYDVWIEDAAGNRLTYIQRYYAQDMKSENEQWMIFINSLGGIDTFRAYGVSENSSEHTHNIAEIDEISYEYRVDTERKFKKNTGYLTKKERLWLLDFFPSLQKFIYISNYVRQVVTIESDVTYRDKELPSNFTFTYKYADAVPYLNIPRTEAPTDVLNIEVPSIGSFTLAPRLVEFQRATLTDGALFPVQNPYSEGWNVTTAAALRDFMAATLTNNYSGGGGIGHTHNNLDLLQLFTFVSQYLLIEGEKIKAGTSDLATFASNLAAASSDWAKILRKDQDDSTPFNFGVGKNLTVGGNQIIKGDIASDNFNVSNQTGFAIQKKEDDDERYKMMITDFEVWGKATFNSLEVRKLVSVGGNYMFSPASGKILSVQYFDTFYRCYFLADDGTMAITNDFRVGDNVFCDTDNIKAGVYTNVANKRYWRTVISVSEVSEILYDKGLVYWGQVDDDHIVYGEDGKPITFISENTLYKGKKFYWIDLSKTLCEVGSDIPAAGDDVAVFGSVSDIQRQDVTYIISFGDDAPALKMYAGINSFDITGKRPVMLSPKNVEIYAKIFRLIATDGSTIDIEKTFAEIKLTQDSISAKINSNGFINSYDPAVYGKVIKGNPYTFWIDQDSEFAAVCSTLTGLTIGNKYTVKIPVKNVDCVSGATFDAYISDSAPTLTSYQENGEYHLIDFSTQGDIYIQFTATSTTMYAGVITGSAGWTNNTGGYAHVEIQNISLFNEDIINALYATGLDIILHKIIATANSFVIRDNNGNINTVFETGVDGLPYLKAQYIKTNDLDIDGTFSERYTFVDRGTFNKVDFSTVNNIAVNRGIDQMPAVVVLPMYGDYSGGNFNIAAYRKAGTNISIQNSYNPNMKNWKEATSLLNGSGKASLRYQLAASSVIIVSDPRIIGYNNYIGNTPLIYANGEGNSNDSIEYRKGRMFCNGKSARIAMILPGQTLRLQSAIETYNGTSYLVWYVVNSAEYTSINKGLRIVGANSSFGSNIAGILAFYASNTYSNWGEGGTYDTDFLIAPKELDAEILEGYDSEEPSIVLDCSETTQVPLFNITER